ncbi:uncharacterized protein C1orf87 isoform X1 [Procambarus clarkii]|uniref:uncharacterized protein C1orf87 isoform X1 n=1 Tax=Procambarus clarkii TaxID=6728 RepID=UPI0037442F9F
MPKRFIPMYDVKIRGGKRIVEWRFGAHPTIHAVSASGVPLLLRQRTQPPPSLAGGPGVQYSQARPPPAPPVDARARGNNFSVLPPIKDSGRRKDESFTLSELDDISLKNEVVKKVKELPERALQGLLINLRAQDRDRDGVLTSDIVKGTLRKFQLHLSDEGARNICKKFGRAGDHAPMVRYEDLLAYLTKSRMEAFKPPPPFVDQRTVGASGSMQQQQQQRAAQQQQDPRKINLRNKVVFSDGDEAKLYADMARQLSDKPVNMADLRRTMYDLDRDRNDFLTGQQAELALYKCGVHLTPDVRARLLLATDRTGAGMYRIETLMNYLTRVVPETHYTVMLGNNHRPRQARVGQLPVFQNQSMLHAPWENNPQQHMEMPKGNGRNDEYIEVEPVVPEPAPPPPPPPPPQPQQRAPQAPPPLPPLPLMHTDDSHEFDMQRWTNDYQYLAQAVYSADEDQSGYMPPDAVHRVAATYNLVYNLQISEASFDAAIQTATDPNYGEVNLEYFITVLQDAHFRENQVY